MKTPVLLTFSAALASSGAMLAKPVSAQSDEFKELAKAVEADEDEDRWEKRLNDIAKQVPKGAPEKPE